MTCKLAQRDNGHSIASASLIVCTYTYVYYNLHTMLPIERGEPEARKLFLPCQPLPVVDVEA